MILHFDYRSEDVAEATAAQGAALAGRNASGIGAAAAPPSFWRRSVLGWVLYVGLLVMLVLLLRSSRAT